MALRTAAVAACICFGTLACGSTAGAVRGSAAPGIGEQVFARSGCAACHVDGAGVLAPSLAGLYRSTVTLDDGSTLAADEAYLRESILAPEARRVAGYQPRMPDFGGQLSDEEVEALVEYLKSLEG